MTTTHQTNKFERELRVKYNPNKANSPEDRILQLNNMFMDMFEFAQGQEKDVNRLRALISSCHCRDPLQCWEPCGTLGHSENHTRKIS